MKPLEWYYAQAGLYLAIPQGTSTNNHGLDFQGYGPDPDLNGLYFLAETGVTPKIGPSRLQGHYAAGFIYWGVENTSFFGQKYDQQVALYWQADQQLFREPSPEEPAPSSKGPSDGKSAAGGKSFKDTVSTAQLKLSDQGLYFFSLVNFAPQFNNNVPFYFQAGLAYKGIIPTRDEDQLGVAFAYGNYSYDKQIATEDSGGNPPVYEAVLEFDYRIQVNQWSYVQPSLQYIIHPNGTATTPNATVLGFQVGVIF